MDCTNIIQQGAEVKYKITITHPGFIQNQDGFEVVLSWGLLGKSLTITKDQMFSNDNDEWYFTFSTEDMVGRVTVDCNYFVPDGDYADGYRTQSDRQYLCFVATTPLPQCICAPIDQCDDHTVTYERTEDSDVEELYAYLVDSNGMRLVTSDNMDIMILKEQN